MTGDGLFDPLAQLTNGDLAPKISRVLGTDVVAEDIAPDWNAARIGKSAGTGTVGIFRVSGQANVNGGAREWSMVLKVLDPNHKGPGGALHDRPETEIAAYRSGLFENVEGDFRAARCYGIDEHSDGVAWLWLEDVPGAPVPPWPPELYASVARQVGKFSGRWISRGVPDLSWLQRGRFQLRTLSAVKRAAFRTMREKHADPMIQLGCPPAILDRVLAMEQDVELVLEALERVPETICHTDCHPKNLLPILDGEVLRETAAIDWASVSIGPVGTDAGPLLSSGLKWTEISADHASTLAPKIFEGYLEGLRDAGWRGSGEYARLGFLAGCAASDGSNIVQIVTRLATDEASRQVVLSLVPRPLEEILRMYADNLRLMRDLLDEAVALAKRV